MISNFAAFVTAAFALTCLGAPARIAFAPSAASVDAYDYLEVIIAVTSPDAANPFTDVQVSGSFESADAKKRWTVDGFCDSPDGSTYKIRFMPPSTGEYRYNIVYRQGTFEDKYTGTFRAADHGRKGPIRVDLKYPWHFVWEGTGEHYFFNGTTAYWLTGWKEDRVIRNAVDRLHRLKVNRIRVTLAGRSNLYFGEPVMTAENYTNLPTVWPAKNPQDFTHPDFDYTRFYIPLWQKFERMLQHARDEDMIISVVLDMNDNKVHPAAGSDDERRFVHYAVARFSAFSNITWDLGDDLEGYRSDEWTHETGTLIEQWDPYHHLATSHPMKTVHQDRSSDWFGFTSYQDWSRKQHALMLESRELQKRAGRIIPQTNEEYGYEDHYPTWAIAGSDSADVLRRTAWDIVMAGGYQTAGETCRRGTNIAPDSGGGWMNGRGDDTMTMFLGYGHMVDFFTSFEWWKSDPHDELVNNGAYCLAKPGEIYAIYLPVGGKVTVQLQPGRYHGAWFSALSGERIELPVSEGGSWTSPDAPDRNDWALLLLKE
ncbi:MAG TPA: DUF5060 domain-containing protein [Bryobacteraceae bacterium]|nr:DUF5060 domain-containing protein [Bryobacteraceae bacterium]